MPSLTRLAPPLPPKVHRLLSDTKKEAPAWAKALLAAKQARNARWRKEGVPFPVGQKQIFLPNFSIALRRTPFLGPYWAQFDVPAWFNKLDMRDYLWHCYGEKVHAIRTFIVPQARQRASPANLLPGKRQRKTPAPRKRMTAQLDRPFVWPEPRSTESLMEHNELDRYQEQARDMQQQDPRTTAREGPGGPSVSAEDATKSETLLRQQAAALRRGDTTWSATATQEPRAAPL